MTEDKEILINDFREKFRLLMTVCDRLREENTALKEKNSDLTQSLSEREDDYKRLSLKCENLRTALSLVSKTDKHDTKIKLNKILREVDRLMSIVTN